MPNDNTPTETDEEKTVPVPRQTNRELVYGDRFADDAGFLEDLRWDREGLR
jgi:hypothetical protein